MEYTYHMIRKALLVVLLAGICCSCAIHAQPKDSGGYELSCGIVSCIYQNVFSLQQSTAVESAVRHFTGGPFSYQAGVRLGFSPALPEAFVRILAGATTESWQPMIGFEFGVTRRARFDAGNQLLQETRIAMESGISPFYLALHSSPLRYRFGDRWRFSFLELQFGTHLSHFGRTLRVQVCLLSAGATL